MENFVSKLKKEMTPVDSKYAISPLIEDRILNDGLIDAYNIRGYAGATGTLQYTPEFPNDLEAWKKMAKSFKDIINAGKDIIIYDEYGYPSGTARGVVPERNPEFIAKGLYCYIHWKNIQSGAFYKANIPDGEFFKALLVGVQTGNITDVSQSVDKSGNLKIFTPKSVENYKLVILTVRRLFEGTHATNNECEIRNYISMADKDATKEFLRITHENYYKYIGEYFGKGIKAFFTDEPSLMSYALVPQLMPILPWMKWYPLEFEKRYGYSYEKAVCSVLLGLGDDVVKNRCDFWEFVSATVANGYFATIKKWCKEHGVASTGHLLSEENLQDHIVNYGSYYESLKNFDWPGIDMLGTIREQLMLECVPFARIASSIADLYCVGESLSEFSDIKTYYGGVYVPIEEYYKSVNWHIAMGINNFVSLYAFKNSEGKELPVDDIRLLNEYTARLNKFMRLGNRDAKIAVLYPDDSMWAEYSANTNYHARSNAPGIVLLNETFCKTTWELFHRQSEFDIVDNDVILKCSIKDNEYEFKTRNYNTLILPCCSVIEDRVAAKIESMIQKGIKVVFVEKIPEISRNSGKFANFGQTFKNAIEKNKAFYVPFKEIASSDIFNIQSEIAITHNGNMRFENILSHTRITENGQRIVMLANIGENEFNCNISVCGRYAHIYDFNPENGEFSDIEFQINGNNVYVSLKVVAGKAKILLFDGEDRV